MDRTEITGGSLLRSCLLFGAALLAAPHPALAHEIGAMKVSATFNADGTYFIDLEVDPEHLPPGAATWAGAPSEEAAGRVALFKRRLVEEAEVAFDGLTAHPAPDADPDAKGADVPATPDEGAGRIRLRLKGEVPRGARTFTFRHGMKLGQCLLSLKNVGDSRRTGAWIEGGATSEPFALRHVTPPPTRAEVIAHYSKLGYTHILPGGLDHILFVLGIFLLSLKLKPVLMQVTAFTVAHSITLGLTIYGVVSLSPRVVEPLIALSIVYVAVENLFVTEFRPWRLAVVFTFGLLHGMGFAGVLRELGLPRSEFLTALVSFNVGVEAGQLSVIALASLAVGLRFGGKSWYRSRIAVPASALIALIGGWWTIQRIFL
jgi:HupE/UreJ protein